MTVTKWKLIKDYPRALRIKGIGAQYIRFAIMIGSWLDEPNSLDETKEIVPNRLGEK
jgi:hypothetical protein